MKSLLKYIETPSAINPETKEVLISGGPYYCSGNTSYLYELRITTEKVEYKVTHGYTGPTNTWMRLTDSHQFYDTHGGNNFTKIDPRNRNAEIQ